MKIIKSTPLGFRVLWVLTLNLLALQISTLRADSYGTGFFITGDGYVVTNHHVVAGKTETSVKYRGTWIEAKVIRTDPANDLAILKVKGSNFPTVALDFVADVRPGDSAFTIGFPDPTVMGFSPKTTKGEISSLTGLKDDVRFYQTTVAIQPGNSGGPLCDKQGNVVGVTSATVNSLNRMTKAGYVPQNVNFGLKASYIRPLLEPIPGVLRNLSPKSDLKEFRKVQAHVEEAVISVKAKGGAPPKPAAVTGTTSIPGKPTPRAPAPRYMIVTYGGGDGVNIRDSRIVNSKKNLHGALYQQTNIPIMQIGNAIWENNTEWVQLKVKGWIPVKNQRSTFLSPEGNGSWKVKRTSDNYVAMRTGTSTNFPLVCKVAYATVVKELDRDFSDRHYHYVLAEFTGWAVKRSSNKEYLRSFHP